MKYLNETQDKALQLVRKHIFGDEQAANIVLLPGEEVDIANGTYVVENNGYRDLSPGEMDKVNAARAGMGLPGIDQANQRPFTNEELSALERQGQQQSGEPQPQADPPTIIDTDLSSEEDAKITSASMSTSPLMASDGAGVNVLGEQAIDASNQAGTATAVAADPAAGDASVEAVEPAPVVEESPVEAPMGDGPLVDREVNQASPEVQAEAAADRAAGIDVINSDAQLQEAMANGPAASTPASEQSLEPPASAELQNIAAQVETHVESGSVQSDAPSDTSVADSAAQGLEPAPV